MVLSEIRLDYFMKTFETLDIIGEPEWIDNELSGRGS